MLEFLVAATGVELSKLVLEQVLNLSKSAMEDYVKDFFKDCIQSGVTRANAKTLEKPMAEAIGFFIKRFIKELQLSDVPETSIEHHYKSAIKRFVGDKAVRPILGKAFERDCKQIDYEQLEQIWTQHYQVQGNCFPSEDFDWRRVAKEYVLEVQGIIKADTELRSLLNTELLEDIARNTAQLSPGFDVVKYRESLQCSYGYLKLYTLDTTDRTDNIKLWNMFIEQTVREALPPMRYELPMDLKRQLQEQGQLNDLSSEALEHYRREYFQQPARRVLEAVAESQHAVILGDPGSGKSTLLQYLALDWVEGKTETLPLLIELREYVLAQSVNFLEFLHCGPGVDWQFDQQQLHQHLLENSTLVVFDGLDEVFDRPTQAVVVDDIIRFAQQYPQAKVLVTSRIIGYNPERFQHAGFRQFTIQPLDETKIHEFIDRWYDLTMGSDSDKVRLKKRLKDAIANSKAIANLADNPLLLTMMAILNRWQELPRDRADLYDQASWVLLYHWDVDHKPLQLPMDVIGRREKQEMLRLIAYEMQAGEGGLQENLIGVDRLTRILTDYLREEGFNEPREKANLLIQQLRERNFILCCRSADSYGFMHRTFLEYFCALEIVHRFEKQKLISFEQLRDEVFGQHWENGNWHEVLYLICGMIDPKFVGQIAEFLLKPHREKSEVEPNYLKNEWDKLYEYILEVVGGDICLTSTFLQQVSSYREIRYIAKILIEKLECFTSAVNTHSCDLSEPELIWFVEECASIVGLIANVGQGDTVVYRWLSETATDAVLQEMCLAAIDGLANNWANDPGLMEALSEVVENNRFEAMGKGGSMTGCEVACPRQVALQVLLHNYPNHSRTVNLLYDRAINDPDEQLREWAQQQLEKLEQS